MCVVREWRSAAEGRSLSSRLLDRGFCHALELSSPAGEGCRSYEYVSTPRRETGEVGSSLEFAVNFAKRGR